MLYYQTPPSFSTNNINFEQNLSCEELKSKQQYLTYINTTPCVYELFGAMKEVSDMRGSMASISFIRLNSPTLSGISSTTNGSFVDFVSK